MLIEKMNMNGALLKYLIQYKVISSNDGEQLKMRSPTERVEWLLDTVSNKSMEDYESLVTALCKTGQRHVAQLLLDEGETTTQDFRIAYH